MDDGIIPATPLEYWSSVGRLDMVKQALAENGDVNVKGQDDYTALHAAAENGHQAVLQYLLERGADVNARVTTGQTPLDLALAAGGLDLAELLRQHGAVASSTQE